MINVTVVLGTAVLLIATTVGVKTLTTTKVVATPAKRLNGSI
jgi:hypothetical protein